MVRFACGDNRMKSLKILIEKHPDEYVAYPLGLKGVVVVFLKAYDQT